MPRVKLPTRDTISTGQQAQWDELDRQDKVRSLARLHMLNPEVPTNWEAVWRASRLSLRVRELVILRCAAVAGSVYEWHAHVRVGRSAGLTDDEMRVVRDWRGASCFTDDEQALFAFVDVVGATYIGGDDMLIEAAYAAVAQDRTDADMFGVVSLVTYYFQLAKVLSIMQLKPDEPFVGWDLRASNGS